MMKTIVATYAADKAVQPQPKKIMKKIILFITTSLTLAKFSGAAETLTINSAHALPDYKKFSAVAGTAARPFVVAFAAGDFNEDGRKDLVMQTGDPSFPGATPWGVKVYLQDANGAFQEKIEYLLPLTGIMWELGTADFNEDGHLDLLLEESDNDLLLLSGNGDGTFRDPVYLGLSAAGFFAVADLNGDKHLDIMAGKLSGGVGVFLGSGNGTFVLKDTLATQVTPSSTRRGEIMLGDINQDGKTDIAVASMLVPLTGTGNLDVFFGNGDGTFQQVIRTPNVAVRRAALGDFNADGIPDYAGDRASTPEVEIWLGAKDGHFTKNKVYSLSGIQLYPFAVKVADVNYDGIADVLVSGEASDTVYAAPIAIFLGNGDGTFQPRIAFSQVNNTRTQNVGPQLLDFDGDGFLDILSLCWTTSVWPSEELMIALSKGVKRDPSLGLLLNIENAVIAPSPLVLEATTNFVNWTTLATNSSWPGRWPLVDSNGSLPYRFYRTRR